MGKLNSYICLFRFDNNVENRLTDKFNFTSTRTIQPRDERIKRCGLNVSMLPHGDYNR